MPRAPSTLDPFTAVAEPKRRQLLGELSEGERSVNQIAGALKWRQPQVSKHLGVLLQVRLVNVRRAGRRRLYRINGQQLKEIHDWVGGFEKFWEHQLSRIKQRAEANQTREKQDLQKE
ncbi:MAG TPA: metalloregulator ArsR/SmtB family transcription factor [Phycisphaerae bacterium]|nr:metalloregulator ArsR/SmtB family transcription factor [Phycisphaerae bacterium]